MHESHVLFERMREAFADAADQELLFMVITLEPAQHAAVASGRLEQVYREVGYNVQRFKQRLNRWLARKGLGQWGHEWVGTIEAHASGTPHLNVLLRNRTWASHVRAQVKARRRFGLSQKESIQIDAEILPILRACGLGEVTTLETLRGGKHSRSKAQSYMAALAKHADASAAEMAKKSQIPYQAPKNFRRIRSGKRFLPPRRKGDQTGTILRLVPTQEGDEEIRPLIQSGNLDYNAIVERVAELEDKLAREEEDERSRNVELNRVRKAQGRAPVPYVNLRDQETTSHSLGPQSRGPPMMLRAGETVPTQLLLEDLERLFGEQAASG